MSTSAHHPRPRMPGRAAATGARPRTGAGTPNAPEESRSGRPTRPAAVDPVQIDAVQNG